MGWIRVVGRDRAAEGSAHADRHSRRERERAVAERLLGSSIADAVHRAVDELVDATGADRADIPERMPDGGVHR